MRKKELARCYLDNTVTPLAYDAKAGTLSVIEGGSVSSTAIHQSRQSSRGKRLLAQKIGGGCVFWCR